jgi:ketosteroid isomerase-like protein
MEDSAYEIHKAVARVNRSFYRIFQARQLDAMRALWLDSDEIQCVHPGSEVLVGRAKVLGSWEAIFEHTQEICFELHDTQIQIAGPSAWVTQVEMINVQTEEGWQKSAAVATNVYVLKDAEWRMALHHGSPLHRRFFPPGE